MILKAALAGGGSFAFAVVFVYAKEALESWVSHRRYLKSHPESVAAPKHRMTERRARIIDAAELGQREIQQAYQRALCRMERAG